MSTGGILLFLQRLSLMDRFKLLALIAVPLMVNMTPGPWSLIPQTTTTSRKLFRVEEKDLTECSGMAVSHRLKDCVWMHNDSGDFARLYLIGPNGKLRSRIEFPDMWPLDFEDMCSYRLDGKDWLLVGDTGDNQRDRAQKRGKPCLYVVEEPKLETLSKKKKKKPVKIKLKPRKIEFVYEDGPQDCEAITVDTQSRTVMLVTKSLNPFRCKLYSLPLDPPKTKRDREKQLVAKIVTKVPIPIATGMDMSPDGLQLLITTPTRGFLVSRPKTSEPWKAALNRKPVVLSLPRLRQSESCCFTADGGMLVSSEGSNAPVFELRR